MQDSNWQNSARLPSTSLVLLCLMLLIVRLQSTELFDRIQGSEDFKSIQSKKLENTTLKKTNIDHTYTPLTKP